MITDDSDNAFEEEMIEAPGPGIRKILVIDDITYVVKSISRILRSQGYFVTTAMTGLEALDKFDKYKPDLITVDQKLPDMSGFQLVSKIRKLDHGEKTKVIFISAVKEKDEIKSIISGGVDNYLLKPFRKETLIDAVRKLLGD